MKRGYAVVTVLAIFVGVTQVDAALIHDAAARNNVQVIEELIRNGEDINLKDEYGDTALIKAAEGGCSRVVNILLDQGKAVDINAQNNSGHTALMKAVVFGREVIITRLLKAGCDVNLKDKWGTTALMKTAQLGDYYLVGFAKELLQVPNMNVYATNDKGETALNIARRNNHEVAELITKYQEGGEGRRFRITKSAKNNETIIPITQYWENVEIKPVEGILLSNCTPSTTLDPEDYEEIYMTCAMM